MPTIGKGWVAAVIGAEIAAAAVLGACSPAGTISSGYDSSGYDAASYDTAATGSVAAPATSPMATPGTTHAEPGKQVSGAAAGGTVSTGFIVDSGPPHPVDPAGRYYVEFRSRWLAFYGHTYVVYGHLDNAGRPLDQHFAALYPKGGYLGLTAGSLPIPVPATTLPLSEDSDYSTLTVYRHPISAAQYDRIAQFVYETRSRDMVWNLYTINCNYFAGEIAERAGLKVPALSTQVSPLYVKELELLNQNG